LKKISSHQITKLLKQSQDFFSLNNISEAEKPLHIILSSYPNHPEAQSKLAVIYLCNNKLDQGIELLKHSLIKDPSQDEVNNNLAIALLNSNQYDEALDTINRLVLRNPNFPNVFFNQALILKAKNLSVEAIESYLMAIKKNSSHLLSYLNLSSCYIEILEYKKAIHTLDQALNIHPLSSEIFYNLGLAHFYNAAYDEAINYLSQTIKLFPEFYQAYNNRGLAFLKLFQFENALTDFNSVIKINSQYAEAYNNRGLAFHKLLQFENALTDFNSAIKINSQYAEAYNNIGVLFQDQKIANPSEFYKKALEIDPAFAEASFNLSIVHLLNLNFNDGFNLYEKRNKVTAFINEHKYLNKPYVDFISNNSQRIIIKGEQGIGDQILFLSLLQEALSINKNIMVYLDKRLVPIFQRSFNSNIFFSEQKEFNSNNYDAHMLTGSLGKQFRSHLNDFKFQPAKYLKPDEELTSKLRSKFHKKIICGISWRSINKDFGIAKSLSLSDLSPILELDNIEFVDLQYGDTSEERADLLSKHNIKLTKIHEIDNFNDIDSLTSLINACDFVITSSNLTAHLAGAIGKKTFLITPKSFGKIWYWQSNSDHALWYPSVIIHSQKEDNNWQDPIRLIKLTIMKEYYGANN